MQEQEAARELLNSDRFADSSPWQVYGTLLDEGQCLCSISTMYRILRAHEEVRDTLDAVQKVTTWWL